MRHFIFVAMIALTCVVSFVAPSDALKSDTGAPLKFKSWKDLEQSRTMSTSDVNYYNFKTDNGSAAHLLVFDTNAKGVRIRPVVNIPGRPTSETFKASKGAIAAVNAGYFNLSNGLSTSYVFLDGRIVCDPHSNPALMGNEKLVPFMPAILDRTELRVLRDKIGAASIQIASHSEPICKGKQLVSSLQAGPKLLPELTSKKEAFVRTESDGKEVDSIGSNRPAARTAFGITPDGHAMILCIASNKQDEFSAGATLTEVAAILKNLGCTEALNFDGGTSTTMVAAFKDQSGASSPAMLCGRAPETRVKTVLLVESAQ